MLYSIPTLGKVGGRSRQCSNATEEYHHLRTLTFSTVLCGEQEFLKVASTEVAVAEVSTLLVADLCSSYCLSVVALSPFSSAKRYHASGI